MSAPYRADHIGSLLRPKSLIDAYVANSHGKLPLEELRKVEDKCILDAIKMQREVGIDVVSDGEYRRGGWTGDFTEYVEGFEPGPAPVRLDWHTDPTAPKAGADVVAGPRARLVAGKLKSKGRYTKHESEYLKQHAGMAYKITMPAASYLVSRSYRPDVAGKAYGSRAEVLAAVAAIVRSEIKALIDEGVPYIQIDNPHYPDYLMKGIRDQWVALGIDPEQSLREDVAADNACLEGLDRSKVTIGMHFCRGNGGAVGWHSEGSYEPIAEQTFGGLNVDRLLLEYDSERAGGFEPLRFVKKGTIVVLGLVTTKAGTIESQDTLLRRIDEAAKYVPLEHLALSPQCGFASVLLGNAINMEEQRRKLELVVTTARKVWG